MDRTQNPDQIGLVMRGVPSGSPLSVLFLFAIVFLLLARRGVSVVASALLAGVLTLGATYSLLGFRESDRQGVSFAAIWHPGRWAKEHRRRLQFAAWVTGAATVVLLGAGVLTGN